MSDVFEYTEAFEEGSIGHFTSSLIEGIYYNENNNEVCLDVQNVLYVYKVNHKSDVMELVNANSVGSYYNKIFKAKFGPGQYLGQWSLDTFEEVPVKEQNKASWGIQLTDGSIAMNNGSVVSGSGINSSIISLPSRKHEVVFTVEDGTDEKTTSFVVPTIQSAEAELKKIADMLDIKLNVKRITVFYE